VRQALGAYVRSLGALDSRFDRAVRGDTAALSGTERRGFNLFMGKARCGTCHFAPLFNGTMPPDFVRSEAEIIGVTDRPGAGARLDPDPGLGGVDLQPAHRGGFKVPTLRNVELTAPYMHNGAFRTLEQVVDFYDRGGAAGAGLTLPTQTLPPDSLRLSRDEKRALVAFLRSLTDESQR
jgi:cytochrome c peroxidase